MRVLTNSHHLVNLYTAREAILPMAERTPIIFGDGNNSFQVGLNNGSISNVFHTSPSRSSILVTALHAARLLLDDLRKISEAPSTVVTLTRDVGSVEVTLKSLLAVSGPQWIALGETVVEKSREVITSCTKSCTDFRTDLEKWTHNSSEGGISLRDRAGLYIYPQNQIQAMSEEVRNYSTTLELVARRVKL
jgi:hypothetical protein